MAAHLVPGPKGGGMSHWTPDDWGCQSKQAFRTRHDADKSIRRPGRHIQRHLSRGPCEPYRCPRCGAWHVGAGL